MNTVTAQAAGSADPPCCPFVPLCFECGTRRNLTLATAEFWAQLWASSPSRWPQQWSGPWVRLSTASATWRAAASWLIPRRWSTPVWLPASPSKLWTISARSIHLAKLQGSTHLPSSIVNGFQFMAGVCRGYNLVYTRVMLTNLVTLDLAKIEDYVCIWDSLGVSWKFRIEYLKSAKKLYSTRRKISGFTHCR